MRVRVNFTIDVDVDQYCDATQEDLTKVEIRARIQRDCKQNLMVDLADQGVKAQMLGVNNVYDPIQKLTVAEHLVTNAP